MILSVVQKWLDPEGYETNQKLKFGVVIVCVVLFTMWKCVVEVQFFFLAETTTAAVDENGLAYYTDGSENRREELRASDVFSSNVQVDYLPGVGLARLHGTRNWIPFVVLLVAGGIGLILLLPVIREARDYAKGSKRRGRKH
jgi:hypothetical protein